MKRLRRLAVALAVLGALAVAADWAVGRFPQERRRALIEQELSDALGRPVHLAGKLRLSILPRPALEATDVTVDNEPGAASAPLLRVQRLRLVLALTPLLQRRLELDSLQADGVDLRLEGRVAEARPDVLGPLARLASAEGSPESSLGIRIRRIELSDARVAWQDARDGGYHALQVDHLSFVADAEDEPVEWSAAGAFRGEAFAFDAKGGTLAGLLHPVEPWPLSLDGRVGETTIRLRGKIAQPSRLEGLDLDVEVGIPDVGSLLAASATGQGLGAAKLRGHLSDAEGEPGLDRLAVAPAPDAELRLRVEGSVRRLADPSGIELGGSIEADHLRVLELLLEHPLPDGTAAVKFRLSDRDGTLGAEGEAHAESRDGTFRVDLSGRWRDLRGGEGLDARLRVAAPSLEALGRTAGFDRELPPLGPVVASARLRERAGVFGVEGLDVDAGEAAETRISLRGSVRDLRAFRGVALQVSAEARSLASLGALLRPARPLPELGPLTLQAKLSDTGGALSAEHFELEGGASSSLELQVHGSLADVRKIEELEVEGRVRARDAALLGSFAGVELPAVGPVVLVGSARGSAQRIESRGTADIGQSRVEGHWSLDLAGGGRPRLGGELHSAHLRLEDVGLGSARGESGGPAWTWSADAPLPFEELRRLDARLALSAERVTAGDSVDVRNARANVELEDGDLRVSDVVLEYQDGSIRGGVRVDARTPDPALALLTDARDLDLTRLGVALGAPEATGSGRLDLALDLKSGGATLDLLRRNLAGRAAFAARDWSSATEHARRFLLGLRRSFLPNVRGNPAPLGCFRGSAELESGVARVDSLVLASPRAVVVGAGSVDLVRARWDLELVPELRDGGLLEVANAVRVSGPLDDPRFKPIPLNMVKGTLHGLARRLLFPATTLTEGAQRALGPAGSLLAPLRNGMERASGTARAMNPGACVLPGTGGAQEPLPMPAADEP